MLGKAYDRQYLPRGGATVCGVSVATVQPVPAFHYAVLLYLGGHVEHLGWDAENPSQITVQWRSPVDGTMWTRCVSAEGKYVSASDPGTWESLVAMGLAGMVLATRRQTANFCRAWPQLITALRLHPERTVYQGAELPEVVAAITQALADAGADNWNELTQSWVMKRPVDVRDQFITETQFDAFQRAINEPDLLDGTRFQGPQLGQLVDLIGRRKHTVLLGPPGVGKSLSAFEALSIAGFSTRGEAFQLCTGHDDIRPSDFLGAWQPTEVPSKYQWVDGPLVRAMTANGGEGQPILVEEWTRMPRRTQNVFISALSDGFVVLNEKHGNDGRPTLVMAGPKFVLIADMNVDPAADDLDVYGAAFASRVRKLEYDYPSATVLSRIVEDAVPGIPEGIAQAVAAVYKAVMSRFEVHQVIAPLSPRGCVHFAEEIVASFNGAAGPLSPMRVRESAMEAARLTWLRDVAGVDVKLRELLLNDVEAHFRKVA